MTELDDHELLAEHARTKSETAFGVLVARYVNLVYSAALRFTGNPHHAEEITQAVFIILAHKAGRLRRGTVLSGWLYQTARLTAANFVKGEIRRQSREQEAYMQSTLIETGADAWKQIAPLLDEAMGRLGETDRNAVVLRYFENKTAQEIATSLKLNEAAAHKRVTRGLEKLRKYFVKRGVTLTATVIAGAVAANSVQAAPVGLAVTVTAAAAKGAMIGGSTLTLVKGALKIMAWTKMKIAIVASIVILAIGGATMLVVSQAVVSGELAVRKIAEQTQSTYAALATYSDTCTGTASGGGTTESGSCTIKLQRPNQYRVEWNKAGEDFESKGIVWSDGNANYFVSDKAENFARSQPQKMNDMQQAFAFANGTSLSLGSTIPCAFFTLSYGDVLAGFLSGRTDARREADEKIGDADCFVLVSVLDAAKVFAETEPSDLEIKNPNTGTYTTTLWIGKKDHLIHQVRTMTTGSSRIVKWTDDMLKRRLQFLNKPATPENLASLRTEMEQAQEQANKTGFIFTETHENIVTDQKISPSDFAR